MLPLFSNKDNDTAGIIASLATSRGYDLSILCLLSITGCVWRIPSDLQPKERTSNTDLATIDDTPDWDEIHRDEMLLTAINQDSRWKGIVQELGEDNDVQEMDWCKSVLGELYNLNCATWRKALDSMDQWDKKGACIMDWEVMGGEMARCTEDSLGNTAKLYGLVQ